MIKKYLQWKIFFRKSNLKSQAKLGLWTGFESLFRNMFYSLVTLQILINMGQNYWNAWNLSMYLWFNVLFIFSRSLQATVLHEYALKRIEDKTIFWKSFNYILLFFSIWVILLPFLNNYFLPWEANNPSWINETKMCNYILLPFMGILMLNNCLNSLFIVKGKTKYYFIQSFATQILVLLPIGIVIWTNPQTSSFNLAIWSFNGGILCSFIFTSFLLKKHFKTLIPNE